MRRLSLLLVFFVAGCESSTPYSIPTIEPSSTPTKTPLPTTLPSDTPVPTLTPTYTLGPSSTPTPLEYIALGPPFQSECGIPLIIADNSFNGPQGEFDSNHGHFDIWVRECDPSEFNGEVIAPISGIIRKGPQSYKICLPDGVFIDGIEEALMFMGIMDPKLSLIQDLCVDLGHLAILPKIASGMEIQKGETLGDLTESHYPSPKLAYQIIFSYNGKFYMASPTIFRHDIVYPINFEFPEAENYSNIYKNNFGPWLCDFRMSDIIASWNVFYCYPEPLAYP